MSVFTKISIDALADWADVLADSLSWLLTEAGLGCAEAAVCVTSNRSIMSERQRQHHRMALSKQHLKAHLQCRWDRVAGDQSQLQRRLLLNAVRSVSYTHLTLPTT